MPSGRSGAEGPVIAPGMEGGVGIGEDDLDKLEEKELPGCIGIDINSAVELEPGMKDIEKIKRMKERL